MKRVSPIVLGLFLFGCAPREIIVNIHTPPACCNTPGCTEVECPYADIVAIHTVLEQTDGTVLPENNVCEPAPEGICTWHDLADFIFIQRVNQPNDAIEVRVEGSRDPECRTGNLVVSCDSFGDHVVDLERDNSIDLWCDCPVATR
jgi:hypothetical protein